MKPLIRRLSQIADSSSESSLCNQIRRRDVHQPTLANSPSSVYLVKRATTASSVPSGHVPVNVGDEMERFVVSAELINHPVFVGLLNRSGNEYGYAQRGVLHIPCNVLVFERVVEILRSGIAEFSDLPEIVASLSGDDLSLWLPGITE
ncbi:unnamed protein product [Arabis nemorensis]|uniref:Uncharacterized protein n=1 Tax=Arabis nemorensis TaxID=586526 RepID=A0A565B2D7_9BRAS|nr:unnamed protein product [Arabis nemorensis]